MGGGVKKFVKGTGLSVAPKSECGINQLSSRIAFYTVFEVVLIFEVVFIFKVIFYQRSSSI